MRLTIALLMMTTAASAQDRQTELEIFALEVVTAHLCEPVMERPGLAREVKAIGREALIDRGHSGVDIDDMIAELESDLDIRRADPVDPFYCETILRDYL